MSHSSGDAEEEQAGNTLKREGRWKFVVYQM